MRPIKKIRHYLDGKSFIYDDIKYEINYYDEDFGLLYFIKKDELDFILYKWTLIEEYVNNGDWKIIERDK